MLRIVYLSLCLLCSPLTLALDATPSHSEEEVSQPEQAVAVKPVARDEEITTRIRDILKATNWYHELDVSVSDGVVFLDGVAGNDEQRAWARNLAAKTQDVVAVVNRLRIDTTPDWSPRPALNELKRLAYGFIAHLPLILLSLLILPLAWLLAKGVHLVAKKAFNQRIASPLLGDILAKAIALPTFLLGVYIVLQVAGLTGIALSMLGGAGVVGIVVGFAFRDIAENFLASLLLSVRRPFVSGDYVNINGEKGIVQSMNTRSTVILSAEGVHIQIPNATIFKSVIHNYTTTPKQRSIIDIGIGYDAAISQAQDILMSVLNQHEAVIDDPLPLVLVDSLGDSTVNLKIYFWFDNMAYSEIKVRSAILRLSKQALLEAGVPMPDPAREIIFPQGIPLASHQASDPISEAPSETTHQQESVSNATQAEGNLANETAEIEAQSGQAAADDDKENLL